MTDKAIIFDKPFPEQQVSPPYQRYSNDIIGEVFVTGGFMEPHGHGYKTRTRNAIYRNGVMKKSFPGGYNIGFDYSSGFGEPVICMYSGTVINAGLEGSYGYRIHIKLDIPFMYKGKKYECYQAYAHCSELHKKPNDRVKQGESLGLEAGHGSFSPTDYGSHVDLDTYIFMENEKIHLNFELLAKFADQSEVVQHVSVMRKGSTGLDVRWLQKKLKIDNDGIFGEKTKSAVKNYQALLGLVTDGIAGEKTCRSIGLTGYAIYAGQSTIIKTKPVQSFNIPDVRNKFDYRPIDRKEPLEVNWIKNANEHDDHWLFELKQPVNNKYNWHAYKPHVTIVKGYNKKDDVSEKGSVLFSQKPKPLSRWPLALSGCSTRGCSIRTAKQEGLYTGGVQSSATIAKKSLANVKLCKLKTIKKVSNDFELPFELVLGIASRESHIGLILGKFGNDEGWGDSNNAWGILQIDKRFHLLRGLDDPYSYEHIYQALEIFTQALTDVERKHSTWPDQHILKGACVAYNAGLSNVKTIKNLNIGTTNNDYADDVIARSQYYLDYFRGNNPF